MSIPTCYQDNWRDTRCNDSRNLHSLISSNQKVMSINDGSGINLAMQLIPKAKNSLVILLSFPHNHPRRLKDLAFITIYIENYLYILKADSLIAEQRKIDALFALLSKMRLFTQFGSQLIPMIDKITTKYKPSNIVDHKDLTSELGIGSGLNDLSIRLFNEPYCRRTQAAPREKQFSNTMKDHLIIQNRMLHRFASDFIADPRWETARAKTNAYFTKSAQHCKQKKN